MKRAFKSRCGSHDITEKPYSIRLGVCYLGQTRPTAVNIPNNVARRKPSDVWNYIRITYSLHKKYISIT